MNTTNSIPETPAETFQESTAPVQVFSSPAVPVLPNSLLEPRLGRPDRIRTEPWQEGNNAPNVLLSNAIVLP